MKQTVTFQVEGMQCDDCASRLQEALSAQPGVEDLSVSFNDRKARIEFDPGVTNANRLDEAIRAAGFKTPPDCP